MDQFLFHFVKLLSQYQFKHGLSIRCSTIIDWGELIAQTRICKILAQTDFDIGHFIMLEHNIDTRDSKPIVLFNAYFGTLPHKLRNWLLWYNLNMVI